MRTFSPTPESVTESGGIIGYPEAGRYVVMVSSGEILGGEIERPGQFHSQITALHRYYPAEAETVVVELDDNGVFTELDRQALD